ncbi:MAG: STAS domain-containing protein [Gammaproteobacteria bacterium]
MSYVNAVANTSKPAESWMFQDGNVLAVIVPSIVDLGLYTSLCRSIPASDDQTVQQILLDCSHVDKLCVSGIAALISLDRLCRDRRIRLMILDPAAGISRQLDPILPNATWIDSCQQDTVA